MFACSVLSNPKAFYWYGHSSNLLSIPSYAPYLTLNLNLSLQVRKKNVGDKLLVVSNDDQWFSLKVKSQPSLMQFVFPWLFSASDWDAVPINTIYGGSKSLTIVEDTTIMICFLSSRPNICTSLVPFGS